MFIFSLSIETSRVGSANSLSGSFKGHVQRKKNPALLMKMSLVINAYLWEEGAERLSQLIYLVFLQVTLWQILSWEQPSLEGS